MVANQVEQNCVEVSLFSHVFHFIFLAFHLLDAESIWFFIHLWHHDPFAFAKTFVVHSETVCHPAIPSSPCSTGK